MLDLRLPDEDGLSWLRGVRGRGDSTPVLVLTARDSISDYGATVQVHTVPGVGYMLAEAKAG